MKTVVEQLQQLWNSGIIVGKTWSGIWLMIFLIFIQQIHTLAHARARRAPARQKDVYPTTLVGNFNTKDYVPHVELSSQSGWNILRMFETTGYRYYNDVCKWMYISSTPEGSPSDRSSTFSMGFPNWMQPADSSKGTWLSCLIQLLSENGKQWKT
jgi:hypothetical protein